MKTAKFQYKCRLCGKIEENPCTSEELAHLALISIVLKKEFLIPKVGTIPHIIEIHVCDDGSCGVSDLIGYKIYDE